MPVSVKPSRQNWIINIDQNISSVSSGQTAFPGALYEIAYWGVEWSNVNKIAKSSNTYPCINRPSINLTIEYMDRLLGGVSTVKAENKFILITR